MKNNSPEELRLHGNVLSSAGTAATLSLLIDAYSRHLLKYLLRHYKKEAVKFEHAASEAVYAALEWYHEHPRQYIPDQGSLRKFLELRAERNFQLNMERADRPVQIHRLEQLLAFYFDNERDMLVAKLLLKNEQCLAAYLYFTDTALRFHQLRTEIQLLKTRVTLRLQHIPGIKPFRTGINRKHTRIAITPVEEYF